MPINLKRVQAHFAKLDRQLTKVAGKPAAENIHRFRTSARRLEVLLIELDARSGRNNKRVLKLLSRLRKRAGRVRDLDVQIALLRGLKMPEGARQKAQMQQAMIEERIQREKKVAGAFRETTLRDLRKRLKRAAAEFEMRRGGAWDRALTILATLGRDPHPLTERMLHRYRIVGKRARYLAELVSEEPEAERLVSQLKEMQDAIGEWHDWLKLKQRAEALFSSAPSSPLVSALRNLTHAKFRHAVSVLTEARAAVDHKKPASVRPTERSKAKPATARSAA